MEHDDAPTIYDAPTILHNSVFVFTILYLFTISMKNAYSNIPTNIMNLTVLPIFFTNFEFFQ